MPTTYADDPRTEGQKAMDEFYNGGGYERANPGAFDSLRICSQPKMLDLDPTT